jgi:hypothetical protein
MFRKFVYLVFDNAEPGGAGAAPATATPDPAAPDSVTPDPAAPDSVTPDPDDSTPPAGGQPVMVPLAKAQAEKERRKAVERENQTLREQLAFEAGQRTAVAAPAAPATPPKAEGPPEPPVQPRANQFDDYADFEAADELFKQADRKYIIDLATYNAKQAMVRESQQTRQQQTETQKLSAFQDRLKAEAALDPDIITLANTFHLPGPNQLPLSDAMQEAIKDSDVGPKLLRHFANNRAEVMRLAAMSPTTQLREIGRIEAAIINKPQPVVKHVTAAPDPIKPVGGNASPDVDEDKIPMSEYLARERARTAERHQRR